MNPFRPITRTVVCVLGLALSGCAAAAPSASTGTATHTDNVAGNSSAAPAARTDASHAQAPRGRASARSDHTATVANATATALAGGPQVEHYSWGSAIPITTAAPAWFDQDLYERVVAAGSRGVPLSSVNTTKGASGASSGACGGHTGAAPTSTTVPSTPTGVERPPVGIGPGTWLISLFCTSVGGVSTPDGFAWCTANFVFRNGTSYGLGTAGHCAAKDALASPVTAVVQPPPEVCADGGSCAPGLYAIGTFSIVHNNGLGDDFAMISIYPQFNSWMRPTMPVFGGPTGAYTGGLAGVGGQTAGTTGVTVTTPAYSPAVVGHCGHGAVVGTGGTCRTGAGLFAASTWYAWYGPSTPGDSGSGVEILGDYASPLNGVPAAADLTHIIILDASVSGKGDVSEGPDQPGMIGGTQMSKILSIVGSRWTLVTGGVP